MSTEVVSGHTGVVTKHLPLHRGQLQGPSSALLGHQHLVSLKHLDRVFVPGDLVMACSYYHDILNINKIFVRRDIYPFLFITLGQPCQLLSVSLFVFVFRNNFIISKQEILHNISV